MTQEEKELLLRDLCARLAYQPLCKKIDTEDDFCECDAPLGYSLRDLVANKIIIKPYLRPMSSMTEGEKEELSHLLPKDWSVEIDKLNNFYFDMSPSILMEINVFLDIIDWLNAHHFDYRGLIEKGLALEAPEGMYK